MHFRPALAALATIGLALPAMAHDQDEVIMLAGISAAFSAANLVGEPEIVDCTLSGGAQTHCLSLTVRPEPTGYVPGPWCPTSASDGPDVSGIWLHEGRVYDADGSFMGQLATLFDDPAWQMVDPETGKIAVTDTKEKCAAAARPDVGAEYANTCVECLPEYLDPDLTVTYVIPFEPVTAQAPSPTQQAGSGVAFNGIRLDAPAPVDAILGAYTIAPFDDCGGHINLFVGYHYHAATDCIETGADTAEDHAAPVGLAMDGHAIFPALTEDQATAAALDACFGHSSDGLGYHYHAGPAGGNAILGCLTAQYGCVLEKGAETCDASQRRGPPPRD
ncbi:YHYH protein [Pseudoruegeria sp. SHC-113]|uniref:YHYH protein n=1 Tax=Pseudoruegeria sp. SHC-113 TaxID=2855439 RepID=UPI0021BB1E6D|nr:YHYH protein [Pseudoruegeria sp. SHC-113]MCT8161459.1 YHYH protein [Pseudoruegeria sp. SHC-113]